jgi:hypothetical protein
MSYCRCSSFDTQESAQTCLDQNELLCGYSFPLKIPKGLPKDTMGGTLTYQAPHGSNVTTHGLREPMP